MEICIYNHIYIYIYIHTFLGDIEAKNGRILCGTKFTSVLLLKPHRATLTQPAFLSFTGWLGTRLPTVRGRGALAGVPRDILPRQQWTLMVHLFLAPVTAGIPKKAEALKQTIPWVESQLSLRSCYMWILKKSIKAHDDDNSTKLIPFFWWR